MAKSNVSTSDALRVVKFEEQLYRDTRKISFFMPKFVGGSSDIIHEKTNLSSGKGDKVTFGIRMRLDSAGVTSGQPLEGFEQKLTTHSFNLELEEYAEAVRDDGPLTRKRPVYDMDEEARSSLLDWGAEKIDSLIFGALAASPTTIFSQVAKYTTYATAKNALGATNKITPGLISKVRVYASTGGDRTFPPIRPIMIEGKKYWLLLVHPDVMYDLKLNSDFSQARREALVQSATHPIFTGAAGVWDGVVIHEHENIVIGTNAGGTTVKYADNMFLGAQAGVFAWGKRPFTVSKSFDYDREHGHSWQMMCKAGKANFNSQDYGSICFLTSRTQISDL